MLIQSLAAPTVAIMGWLWLGETYLLHQWIGMAVALSGVTSVILDFALVPISIIPFSIFLHKEHVSIRAVAGAFVAVIGVYLLTM